MDNSSARSDIKVSPGARVNKLLDNHMIAVEIIANCPHCKEEFRRAIKGPSPLPPKVRGEEVVVNKA